MSTKFTNYTFRAPLAVVKSFEALCRLKGQNPEEVMVLGLIKVFKLELDKTDLNDAENLTVRPRRKAAAVKAAPKKPGRKPKAAAAPVKVKAVKTVKAKPAKAEKPVARKKALKPVAGSEPKPKAPAAKRPGRRPKK